MDRLNFWLAMLALTYPVTAMCLMMLGQSARPVAHLVKATTFWYIVTWVLLALVMVGIRLSA